ncbi:A-kinase anchor protein 12-like [Cololabis saira]|uniref:A-kinase anchor protein 12-like n=1 Tax=Cololabis saira TaxID=129043 RepID=UPI002AD3A80C|nr:A-kinase anchor protein 12-like [Cololabis saira]
MGDAQSAQREGRQDAAAAEEEEGGKVQDAATELTIDDKPLKTNGQISDLNGKADSSIAALNGNCEDDIPAVAEDAPLKSKDIDGKELPDVACVDEVPTEVIDMEAKQNDINESFKKFFSNIGMKLTVKRGSTDKVLDEEPEESAESVKDTANDISFDSTDPDTRLTTALEPQDSDSPTYQTLIDITCEELIDKDEEKTADTKEEVTSDDAGTSSPMSEYAHQGATSEEEPHQTSPSGPDTKEIATQFKKFFTSGIFSGLKKKKKSEEEDFIEKELVNMGGRMSVDTVDQDEEEMADVELGKNDLKNRNAGPTKAVNEAKSRRTSELETQARKKVRPGSGVKKVSKKQKSRKSSEAKLSDSVENISDQLLSSTESTGKDEAAAQPSTDTAEEGAWASFVKLMTPQRRNKRPSVDQAEARVPGPADAAKPGKAEQISDHSTEEGRKRKDSSVSWEAVLCGSGRRRSHKTSDSEGDNEDNKEDSEPKEGEVVAPEDNEGSTWKSFKKLVTPTKKVSQDERKDTQSEGEVAQDDSSFSIKKFLSVKKKSKTVEKPDQVYHDDADEEAASDEEDSETPAVVPLSEFDEPEDAVQKQADVERDVPQQANNQVQQKILDEITESIRPGDSLPTKKEEIQEHKEALDANKGPTVPAAGEEVDDLADVSSKHQQLSDIPEEGAITDTTPGSIAEVAARDDTIAEDLIEITSEAVTAPEPVDVTLADETEMVSAVSHLSESSKTSGNTTPVPAEYNIMNTELLLQQVTETITESPRSVPVYSEEQSFERIACSVTQQVLESSVTDQPKILEVHRKPDVAVLDAELSSEAIDAVDELVAEAQTNSASPLNEAISTEIVSEVPTEAIDVAESAVDEVHEADVLELQGGISQLEAPDQSQHVGEVVSEASEAEKEEEEAPVIDQGEEDISRTDSQEGESVAMLGVETDEAALKEEGQILAEEEVETLENDAADQSEELAAVETAALDSEECKVQQLEVSPSEDNSTTEMDTDEPRQTAEYLSELTDESGNKEPEIDDAKVTEALEAGPAATLESEEGTVESIEVPDDLEKKEPRTEDVEVDQAATLESGENVTQSIDKVPSPEDIPSQVHTEVTEESQADAAKETEVPEVEQAKTFESEDSRDQSIEEVASEDTLPTTTETVEQVPEGEAEPLNEAGLEPDDAHQTVEVQEPAAAVCGTPDSESVEVVTGETPAVETVPGEAEKTAEVDAEPELSPDIKDITEAKTDAEATTTPDAQAVVESGAQDLGRETLPEAVPEPEETNLNAAAQPEQPSEMNDVGEKESIPCDADVRQEQTTAEAAEELKALTAVHVSSVSEKAGTAQVLEKTVCTEESPAPLVDSAEVSHEPAHEVNLCGVQETVQGEKVESVAPGVKVKVAGSDHAVVEQVVTCCLKNVPQEKPNVPVNEPPIGKMASETETCGVVETALPLVQEDINEISEVGSMVVMTHVPSVEFQEHQKVQVQLMNEDIRKAENNFDATIEVGVSQTKEVIDVCHETIQKVENLSAAPVFEGEVGNEGIKVTVQKVIRSVQRTEAIPESFIINVEQVFEQLDGMTEREVEGTVEQRQDDVPAVISDGSPAQDEGLVSDELKEKSESPESVDASIHECREETEIDQEKSQVRAMPEEVAVKKLNENTTETEKPQTTQSQIVSHSNAGLAVPQNTGLVSSIGTVESPSSLSLEFKLNIQFGQTKGPTTPPSTTETTEPEVGVQAANGVDPAQPRNVAREPESEKMPKLNEVAVQATEGQEPAAATPSTQRAVIASQPVLHDIGIQAMEIIQTVEQIKCTERVEPMVHAAEAIQPQQKERTTMLLGKLAVAETKEIFKSMEEESQDLDVWLDAEEDICMQEESQVSTQEAEGPVEEQAEQKKETELELELETACNTEAEVKDNQEETHKTSTREIESEGEDFAVASEDLEPTAPAV